MKKYDINTLTRKQLCDLRKDICLGSLYISDYKNRFGIDPEDVCAWFEGFLSFVEDIMKDDIEDFDDDKFWDYLDNYDNGEYYQEWQYCHV